jgi:hypothetical protein
MPWKGRADETKCDGYQSQSANAEADAVSHAVERLLLSKLTYS